VKLKNEALKYPRAIRRDELCWLHWTVCLSGPDARVLEFIPPLSPLWYRCYIFHGHWVSGKGFISLQCWLQLLITRLTLKQGYSPTHLGAYFPHSGLERTLDKSTLQWLRINSGLSRRLLMAEALFQNQSSPWQIWCVKASRRLRSFYQALLLSLAKYYSTNSAFFFCFATAHLGPRPPHCWGF